MDIPVYIALDITGKFAWSGFVTTYFSSFNVCHPSFVNSIINKLSMCPNTLKVYVSNRTCFDLSWVILRLTVGL
jgi:hypothetical protein